MGKVKFTDQEKMRKLRGTVGFLNLQPLVCCSLDRNFLQMNILPVTWVIEKQTNAAIPSSKAALPGK